MAEVLHFYSLGWEEMLALPLAWFCKLYTRIPAVDARRQLAWLPALSYPHLTEAGTRQVRQGLERHASGEYGSTTAGRTGPPMVPDATVAAGWARLRSMGVSGQAIQQGDA
jgi:hypothetical protein